MTNYVQAFYAATNGLCEVVTSAMCANEQQGVNLTSMNNKMLNEGGFKYKLAAGQSITLPSYQKLCTGFDAQNSTIYAMVSGRRASWHITDSQMSRAITGTGCKINYSAGTSVNTQVKELFGNFLDQGVICPSKCPSMTRTVSRKLVQSATISQLVANNVALAKAGASAATMTANQNIIQAANIEFSNVKNEAQTGTSELSGLVDADANELTAGANMLSSFLQSLANPVTVS